jgi:hypothetical protein
MILGFRVYLLYTKKKKKTLQFDITKNFFTLTKVTRMEKDHTHHCNSPRVYTDASVKTNDRIIKNKEVIKQF